MPHRSNECKFHPFIFGFLLPLRSKGTPNIFIIFMQFHQLIFREIAIATNQVSKEFVKVVGKIFIILLFVFSFFLVSQLPWIAYLFCVVWLSSLMIYALFFVNDEFVILFFLLLSAMSFLNILQYLWRPFTYCALMRECILVPLYRWK